MQHISISQRVLHFLGAFWLLLINDGNEIAVTCQDCGGTGINDICPTCRGTGSI